MTLDLICGIQMQSNTNIKKLYYKLCRILHTMQFLPIFCFTYYSDLAICIQVFQKDQCHHKKNVFQMLKSFLSMLAVKIPVPNHFLWLQPYTWELFTDNLIRTHKSDNNESKRFLLRKNKKNRIDIFTKGHI